MYAGSTPVATYWLHFQTPRRKMKRPGGVTADRASGFLERETGFEPATLSLGREDEPEETPPLALS